MIRLSIVNQRGGAAKTTTTSVLARCFATEGCVSLSSMQIPRVR